MTKSTKTTELMRKVTSSVFSGAVIGFLLPFGIFGVVVPVLIRAATFLYVGPDAEIKLFPELVNDGIWWGLAIGVGSAISTATWVACGLQKQQGGKGHMPLLLIPAPFIAGYVVFFALALLMPGLAKSRVNSVAVQTQIMSCLAGLGSMMLGGFIGIKIEALNGRSSDAPGQQQ